MNFYFSASDTLNRLEDKRGSIKSVLASLPEKDRKRTSALVIETLKYKSVLNEVIDKSSLLSIERKKITSRSLALVLIHDLLLSPGGIQAGDGPIKQAVLRHRTRLHSELQRIKIKKGVANFQDLAKSGVEGSENIPRYARVNTALWSPPDALSYFLSKGLQQGAEYEGEDHSIIKDSHLPYLLMFHPCTNLTSDDAYLSGKIILQDKASCFPAAVLNPPPLDSTTVIDATAAPGNKTTHLSALMCNRGKIHAFERDGARYKTLQTMVSKAHCRNVHTSNMDFLNVDPADSVYSDVAYILLDPSCSGSGIVNRLDHLLASEEETPEDDNETQIRLERLAAFQLKMIQHAMKFRHVKKIAYSTCSTHAVENEDVVAAALASAEALAGNFVLAPKSDVLPSWPRRGLAGKLSATDAEKVIRCNPATDKTNGFFVACFVRSSSKISSSSQKRAIAELDSDTTLPQHLAKKKKRKKNKHKQGPGATP